MEYVKNVAGQQQSNTLRIAMIGQKSVPSRAGGIEVVVEELATRMVKKGCEVTCFNRINSYTDKNGINRNCYKGVRLKTVFTINKKGLAAVSSSFFAAFRAAFGPYDVVHFHAEGPCAMLWLPKLMGKRCIATIHGLDWQREKWKGFAKAYIKFSEKIAAKYADEVIVLSESIKQYFQREYGRITRFIPNGVEPMVRRDAQIIMESYSLEKDGYILFLGRLVPEKGIEYLIEAFQKVRTDKKLVIAGGSSDTDEFVESLKKRCNDERILFTGFVQGELLEELFGNCYVYCLPSDLEGMPISLLEAMSYGNCCLVSDIAECTEVVEDKAAVFRKGDVDDLREKLQMLCDQSKLVEAYRKNASHFICEKYNWENITAETLKLYQLSNISNRCVTG